MKYVRDDKTILVDCDGVLLDWEYAFDVWMHRHGHTIKNRGRYLMNEKYDIPYKDSKLYIRMFNESAAIGFLPPLRDAIHYIRKLHEKHGYVFHVISSLSDEPAAHKLRILNLEKLFGKTTFERYEFLDTGADKDEALAPYKDSGCWWIEDKPENALVGESLGLNPIVVAHEHNKDYNGVRLNSWYEIYNKVTGNA